MSLYDDVVDTLIVPGSSSNNGTNNKNESQSTDTASISKSFFKFFFYYIIKLYNKLIHFQKQAGMQTVSNCFNFKWRRPKNGNRVNKWQLAKYIYSLFLNKI